MKQQVAQQLELESILSLLLCPVCHGESLCSEGGRDGPRPQIRCAQCGTTYPVVEGVPIMLSPDLRETSSSNHAKSPGNRSDDKASAQERCQKAGQIRFFDEVTDSETEIERPACYPKPVRYLLKYKMDSALDLVGPDMEGKRVMVACCGSGMDAEFIANRGAHVYALDLSLQAVLRAVERSHRHKFMLCGIVGDAENLPFRSGAFHYSIVHDGLHHIPDPRRGVRELIRVAAIGALIVEPANAAFTRLGVRLGIARDYEDAGNYVFRLRPEDLKAVFLEQGLRRWHFQQDLIYCQPWTFRPLKYFESLPLFCVFRLFFHLSNVVLGRWGNSLKAVAWKQDQALR